MEVVAGAVAEAVLSVSLDLLFEKLSSSDVLKFARQKHLENQLKLWEGKLLEISEVLNDAEGKQIDKSVKDWLSDLRDLTYDMEDVLDEFSYEALRRSLYAEDSTSSQVPNFIRTCCVPVRCNVKMGSKIKDLNTRLEAIYARKGRLGLDKVAAITQSTGENPPTTSIAYEPWVFGRVDDKKNIMDMLLEDDEPSQADSVSVVSIVAMGGMGKTTLASMVYDKVKIPEHFNLKAWARVSDPFDVVKVTKTILEKVNDGSSNDSQEFHQIQEQLREALKGKKFLLVLDDVWTEDYGDWLSLQLPFLSGAPGSKIIITTRNKNVATKIMGGDKNLYELSHLSDDDCWSVFLKHAFVNNSINEYPELEPIGRAIVNKCGGLPLAARALGGLLRNQRKACEWNIILNSPILDQKSNILPALRLSYSALPSPLKRCFGYCAIFPKDHEFDKEELIRLWMAEGFIQQLEGDMPKIEMEDQGDNYFQELLSRSFFQPLSSKKSSFVMHDLVNDLAKCVASDICFSLEENLERNYHRVISNKFRHSSFPRSEYDVFKKFEVFHRMEKHLRTFVALPIHTHFPYDYLSNKVDEELIPKLKGLRVLSLSCYKIYEIPNSIGALKHLRYLNLSGTKVKCLPESIGNLYMLQTLILSSCSNLRWLPHSILNLNKLRYLDVTCTPLEGMPPHFGKFKSLQRLPTFIVGKYHSSLKDLGNMSNLGGSLHISELKNTINVKDARSACLDKKYKLENLRMSWIVSGNFPNQLEILDSLQPHLGLTKLTIEEYGGLEFPHWLEDVRFCKVVEVKLVGCKNCMCLPCLGQLPMLKDLAIEQMDKVKHVGQEFHGGSVPFPKLESLIFSDMPQWEDWESPSLSMLQSYPRLLWLTIQDCPKLTKELPTYLPSLVDLDIEDCPRLEFPLTRFPSLSKLSIGGCSEGVVRGGVDFHSLEKLEIFNIVGLVLQEGFLQLLFGLQALKIHGCHELRWLWEENGFDGIQQSQTSSCPGLEHQGLLSKLQSLEIWECANLENLPDGLHRLTCLKELRIWSCRKLSSFPNSGFPPMLTLLQSGPEIVCFPKGQLPPTLQTLIIYNCKNLESLPEGQYCRTLKEFDISNCVKLKSLPRGMMMQPHDSTSSDGGLHVLEIEDCPSLECFPAGKFPPTLKKLTIRDCQQLEPISEKMFHFNNNNINSLEDLMISWCPSLKIIPDWLYNLRNLEIYNCQNLKRLPRHLSQNLQALDISRCENFDLEADQLQGLTALTSLWIHECKSMRMPLSSGALPIFPLSKDSASLAYFQESPPSQMMQFHHFQKPSPLLELKISRI